MDREQLLALARNVAKGTSVNFGNESMSHEQMKEALIHEIRELMPKNNAYAFEQNKVLIMEILTEIAKEILPRRVNDLMNFAEVKRYNQNEKVKFVKRSGRERAKSFVTRVGLAGVYETFRLDNTEFEVSVTAYGGAGSVSLERMLDGHEDLMEIFEILQEGLEDRVFEEVVGALYSLQATLPTANTHVANAFVSAEMKRLISTARAYGDKVTIFCFPEFASTVMPDPNFISDADKNDYREKGYIGKFAGADVVVIPQTFTDTTNTVKKFDPSKAIIIPSVGGAKEKSVKVAFEGDTLFRSMSEKDWSTTIEGYQKFGVGVLAGNHICIYENTTLK